MRIFNITLSLANLPVQMLLLSYLFDGGLVVTVVSNPITQKLSFNDVTNRYHGLLQKKFNDLTLIYQTDTDIQHHFRFEESAGSRLNQFRLQRRVVRTDVPIHTTIII